MKPFLRLVAEDLWKKSGGDLSKWTIVFPNKRAGLFFDGYLAEIARKPVWSPEYITVNELFQSFSPLKVADSIEAVCVMHRILSRLTNTVSLLDTFYGWGERLLADFDDVDKHIADAKKLFINLKDIKELDSYDFVDEEQKKFISELFQDYSLSERSKVKENFLGIWNHLYDLYEQLNSELRENGTAYEGAMFRNVVEALDDRAMAASTEERKYAIVGFNVIDTVEQRLFDYLKGKDIAFFYWDYDVSYCNGEIGYEAGVFLNDNLERYGNELPKEFFDNLRKNKEIEYISSPTETAQAKYTTPWLLDHVGKDEKRTAVVLCNESLLHSVIHALPPGIKNANVTKGYPLHHTQAYTLIATPPATDDKRTPIEYIDGLIKDVEKKALATTKSEGGSPEGNVLLTEAYFSIYTILNRVREYVDKGLLNLRLNGLNRIIKQIARTSTIPFHGEPAMGVQIMGVLETRCLDFDNILMLSVNEGNIPQKASNSSFIPYCLRKAFGLSLPIRKTAVYAYYFYRLISRAKHVTMMYNCSSDGLSKGEMSRFMSQLLVESPLNIKRKALVFKQNPPHKLPSPISKPKDLDKTLRELSPSSINAYMRCQSQFYFQYVAKLDKPEKLTGVIPANIFGTIFHKAAELFYLDRIEERGGEITKEMLKPFVEHKLDAKLHDYVDRAYKFEMEENEEIEYNIIVVEVVLKYLRRLLSMDYEISKNAPFKILGLEEETHKFIPVMLGSRRTVDVKLKGYIDRRDEIDYGGERHVRIVDYKTGGKPEKAKDIVQLFTPSKTHPHYVMQTFLYSLTVFESEDKPVMPSLIFIHKAGEEDYSPYITLGKEKVTDFGGTVSGEFMSQLIKLISEILDTSRQFVPTDNKEFCKTCKFKDLCYS